VDGGVSGGLGFGGVDDRCVRRHCPQLLERLAKRHVLGEPEANLGSLLCQVQDGFREAAPSLGLRTRITRSVRSAKDATTRWRSPAALSCLLRAAGGDAAWYKGEQTGGG
jgi:hypothetical protein